MTATQIWALHIAIPVQWSGNLGLRAGSGTLVRQLLAARTTRPDGSTDDDLRLCGAQVPDSVASIGGELYGIRFPDALFDRDVLPHVALHSRYDGAGGGGAEPGASFVSEPVALSLGVRLPQPTTDVWPGRWSALQEVVDDDGDGLPGISLVAETAPGYALPRTSLVGGGNRRATHFYTAERSVVALHGRVVAPDLAVGEASIPSPGGTLALDSHVLGCRKASGDLCTSRNLDLIGSARPAYALAGPARVRMQRLADDATCATVRALPNP